MDVKTLTGEEYEPEGHRSFTESETLIISKLINIENRITTIETSMTWFKFIARGGIITIAGFLGFNLVGVI